MHLRQIEAFVAVVRYKSFSRAAEAIYLSQPTISAHINSLESELGAKLIVRSTREVYPSAAGRIFYGYALELLRLRDKAISEVKSYSTEVRGRLDIAASTVPSQYILPEVLPALVEKYPNVFFTVNQFDSSQVVSQVVNMEAEIGITGALMDKNACTFEPFLEDRLVIITPNTPFFAALNGVLTAKILIAQPFIIREQGSGTMKEAEDFLRSIGVEPRNIKRVAQLQSTESVKQAVRNKLGISIVSKIAAADYLESGSILAFDYDSTLLNRNFYFVYHKNRPLSPAAEAFLELVRNKYKK